MSVRKTLIEANSEELSITKQCELLKVSRSSYYCKPKRNKRKEELDRKCKQVLLKIYKKWPFYGARRMKIELKKKGFKRSNEKIIELMKGMGLRTLYPKKKNNIKIIRADGAYPFFFKM